MAGKTNLEAREMESYVDTGKEKSINITLSTAGTVTTVTLPNEAKGFRVYTATDPLRFAVNETVEAAATSALTTIPASAFSTGGDILTGFWDARLLPSPVKTKQSQTPRTLSFRSTADNSVFTLELF